ncbi:hypothetical protein ACFFOP_18430 [Sinosporangium siamense]
MIVIEEGAKKSSVLWISLPGSTRPRLAWHTWHDGAIYVVCGGAEQPLPGLAEAARVRVTLRSKDNGSALTEFDAAVEVVDQATAPEAVAALAKDRLNAPDAATLTDRWAATVTVVRLTPAS